MKKAKGSIQPAGSSGREMAPLSSRHYFRILLAILTVAVYSLKDRFKGSGCAQEYAQRHKGQIQMGRGTKAQSFYPLPLCAFVPLCLAFPPQGGGGECWAQENSAASAVKSTGSEKNATWDSLRDVQESLKKREAKIQETEGILEKKEQRLDSVKQEIIQRLEELKLLKKEIDEKGKQLDEQQEKRIKDLSKIFEGTPAEKAGSIIAQTDISTAAEIIMRMDKRKAGQLWGFVDPKLAAEITRNIIAKGARTPAPRAEKKPSTRQSSGQ